MSGFDVDLGELRSHASTVATISTQVGAACRAARSSVTGDAYGVVGQFFAAAMILASDEIRDGIARAAGVLHDVRDGLAAVADLYEELDEAHAQLLSLTTGQDRS